MTVYKFEGKMEKVWLYDRGFFLTIPPVKIFHAPSLSTPLIRVIQSLSNPFILNTPCSKQLP